MREGLRRSLPVATLLLGVTVAVFWEAIFTGRTFFSRDLFHLYYPIKLIIRESFLSGELPLWNPHNYCGVPFLGDFISSPFYPLNVIFLILPMGAAFKVFIITHYFLAALFGFLYIRSRGGSREAALFVGIAFGFSGYLISVHNNLIYLQTGIWTPLLLLLSLRAREGWRWTAGAALVLGIQVLGGDLQGALLAALLSALACLLLPAEGETKGTPGARRALPRIAAILLGAIAVSAIHWVPAAAWAAVSPRGGGLSYAEAAEWSLHPLQLLEMIVPGFFGDRYAHTFWGSVLERGRFGFPWAHAVTIGILPLVLAIRQVITRRPRRETVFWGVVCLSSLVLALGSYLDVLRIVHAIPGFSLFRYPAKYFYFTTLSLAFLSGMAFDRLRPDPERAVVSIRNALLATGSVLLLSFCFLILFRAAALDFLQGVTHDLSEVDSLGAFQTILITLLKASFVLGILTILLHLKVEGGIRDGPFFISLVIATALELAVIHAGTRFTAPADLYTNVPRTVEAVRSVGLDGYRFAREGGSHFPYDEMQYRFRYRYSPERKQRFFADSLQANLGVLYGLDDAFGYSPAEPGRLLRFMEALRDRPARKYSLLGVRAFVAVTGTESKEIPLHRLEVVAPRAGERFAVLRNPLALPRAMLFGHVIEVPTEERALDLLREPGFDPLVSVILEGGEGETDLGDAERNLEIVSRGRSGATIRVTSEKESILLWNECFSPGWEASIEGVPAEIRRANFLMQVVRVPPGTRTVTLRYRPSFVYRAGWISLAAGVLLLIVGLAARSRKSVRG